MANTIRLMASKHRDIFRLSTKAMRGECDVKEVKVPVAHVIIQGVSPRRDGDYLLPCKSDPHLDLACIFS